MPIEFNPPRRLIEAFIRYRARKRQPAMRTGPHLTTETIEASNTDGTYQVKGKNVGQAGQAQLRAGETAVVAWKENNTPVAILAHSARRIKPVSVGQLIGSGIVEELFIAARASDGVIDVHFRNDKQLVPLRVREQVPSDPIAVRWGWDKKSFTVQCGNPARVDFKISPSAWFNGNENQNQTFWVFTLSRNPAVVIGAAVPKATLRASFAPRDSTIVVARNSTNWNSIGAVGHPIIGGTSGLFVFESMVSDSLSSIGAGASSIQLGTLLGQTLGPVEISEFFTNAQGHFLIVVRARAYLGTTITVNQNDVIIDALGSGGLGSHTVTGQTQQFIGEPGEMHLFVVDLTDGIVLFTTIDSGTIALEFSVGGGSMATFTGTIIHLGSNFTWDNLFYLGVNHWSVTDPFPPPESVANVGVMGSAGNMRRWSDAWDEARFPFITESSLKRNGTFATGAVTEFFTETPANGIQFNWFTSATVFPLPAPHWYAVRNARLIPAPLAEVKAGTPFWIFLCVYRRQFIDPINTTMDYACYVIRPNGEIVAMLLDWTPMAFTQDQTDAKYVALATPTPNKGKEPLDNPVLWVFAGPTLDPFIPLWNTATEYAPGTEVRFGGVLDGVLYVPSEMDGNTTVHDGATVDLLGANQFHILWTRSTGPERRVGVRHINLTKMPVVPPGTPAPLTTKDVGTDWTEFARHDFRVVNLDAMYAAEPQTKTGLDPRDKAGRFFVNAWVLKDGVPTLAQVQSGYPLIDHTLDSVKNLHDLTTLRPTAVDYQAINDTAALVQTGRTLKPSASEQ